jgi:hypothetical protein
VSAATSAEGKILPFGMTMVSGTICVHRPAGTDRPQQRCRQSRTGVLRGAPALSRCHDADVQDAAP